MLEYILSIIPSLNMTYRLKYMALAMIFLCCSNMDATTVAGIDVLISENQQMLKGKNIAIVTNCSAITRDKITSIDALKSHQATIGYKILTIFSPEHGISGANYALALVDNTVDEDGIPIYSLYGETRRPTDKMLNGIDTIIYDIQDIGSRSYTYISTLFYIMEAAAKKHITVIVADRPNPINGIVIDGPMLDDKWRSFVGYINVPYCHGMTVGELALFFNTEYKIGCTLIVIPMSGWERTMSFNDTGLTWVPTSPNIPESDTAYYYPMTGILGELSLVNIGIGYTMPFKIVGAPWIDAKVLTKALNQQKFPGIHFMPFNFMPFYGLYAKKECGGVIIIITNHLIYKPVSTQYLIMGVLKTLYPKKFNDALNVSTSRKNMFCKINGTSAVYDIMQKEKYIIWRLCNIHKERRDVFIAAREKYLIPQYKQ